MWAKPGRLCQAEGARMGASRSSCSWPDQLPVPSCSDALPGSVGPQLLPGNGEAGGHLVGVPPRDAVHVQPVLRPLAALHGLLWGRGPALCAGGDGQRHHAGREGLLCPRPAPSSTPYPAVHRTHLPEGTWRGREGRPGSQDCTRLSGPGSFHPAQRPSSLSLHPTFGPSHRLPDQLSQALA